MAHLSHRPVEKTAHDTRMVLPPTESFARFHSLVDHEFKTVKEEAARRHPEIFDFSSSLVRSRPPPGVEEALRRGVVCHRERGIGCKQKQQSIDAEHTNDALTELKIQLARYKGGYFSQHINAESIVLATRLRSSLAQCLKCFVSREQSILIMPPCFSGYEVAIAAAERRVCRIALKSEDGVRFFPDLAKVGESIRSREENVGAVLVSTPNNPTGLSINPEQLLFLQNECREKGIVLLIDDTFEAFRGDAPANPRLSYTNVVYLGSFGESYGVPSNSVESLGYAITSPELAARIETMSIADPPPTQFAQEIALVAFQEHERYLDSILPKISENQAFIRNALRRELPAIACGESLSLPFIYLYSPKFLRARNIAMELASNAGVFVAPANSFGGSCALRVGVGEVLDQRLFQKGVTKLIGTLKKMLH